MKLKLKQNIGMSVDIAVIDTVQKHIRINKLGLSCAKLSITWSWLSSVLALEHRVVALRSQVWKMLKQAGAELCQAQSSLGELPTNKWLANSLQVAS